MNAVGKFRNVQLHQKLWSVQLGSCKVTKLDLTSNIRCGQIICVGINNNKTCSYGFNGKSVDTHEAPSLYFEDQTVAMDTTVNPYPKFMMVRDTEKEVPQKKIVIGEVNDVYLAIDGDVGDLKIEDISLGFSSHLASWSMAEDIPPRVIKKMTMEEIAKQFGVDEVEIIPSNI